MILKCGIIGLPNVGKSTLFNALVSSNKAEVANYPFCTIEPNIAIVPVFDSRLDVLKNIVQPNKVVYSHIKFVDIAGLVQGANNGTGLGNKFLSHIREVDAIIHVLRCFQDSSILHTHDTINPIYDLEIVETELQLSDLELVERVLNSKLIKQLNEESISLLNKIKNILSSGNIIDSSLLKNTTLENFKELELLTLKEKLYVCNVDEKDISSGNSLSDLVKSYISNKAKHIVICSKIEYEISQIPLKYREEILLSYGLQTRGIDVITSTVFDLLKLHTFFTVGKQEIHSWSCKIGTKAYDAAGIIHSDFKKGFIKAEIISYNDYVKYQGDEFLIRELGKIRIEGKDYTIQNGDIVHFRFNI